VPLEHAFGRTLRETVRASVDLPPFDRSAVDGYAILSKDVSPSFRVVDSLRAGDWRPRQLQPGEAVRVATGAALPCEGVRVVMQEDTAPVSDQIQIARQRKGDYVRRRGEDIRKGQPVVVAGTRLDAGALAILASLGHAMPVVSPCLRVQHFTTGDELVAPTESPGPGQIRDSNSILLSALLSAHPCQLQQEHLPEDLEAAWSKLDAESLSTVDLLLVSGGASVGERDFTRALLERLGYEIVFHQLKSRPGKPCIFAVKGARVAFGLPGNPLAHFVCFHLCVTTALAVMSGAALPAFVQGQLAESIHDEASPRETFWPARLTLKSGQVMLSPLRWQSSGDITCLIRANALLRFPANTAVLERDARVDFLPLPSDGRGLG
jgi:molybdopterin molybdotransferase